MRRIGLLLAGLCLASCEPEAVDQVAAPVRADSAGVQIVTIGGEWVSREGRFRDYEEAITISADGEHDMSRIAAARWLSGRIAVAVNGPEPGVLLFDSMGVFLRRLGRAGEGPGEFRYIGALLPGRVADSIDVYDARLRRLTTFAPSGELLSAVDGASMFGSVRGSVAFMHQSGDTVMAQRVQRSTAGGHLRPVVALETYEQGKLLSSRGPLEGTEEYILRRGAGSRSLAVPFGRRLLVYPIREGAVVLDTDVAEARYYDFGLRLQRIVRFDVPQRPVTDDDLTTYIDSVLSQYSDPAVRRTSENFFREIHSHDFRPAVADMIVGSTGEAWWRLDLEGEDGPLYHVIRPDGTYCCKLGVDPAVQLLDVTEEAIVVLRQGALGVDEVAVMKRDRRSDVALRPH